MVPVKGAFLVNEANVSYLHSVLGSPIDGDWKHNYATNDVSPANDENIEVTVGNVQFHDVSRGDTVVGLARKYSTTIEKIRRWNSLEQDKIQVGQRLRVK
jgi:LysM repeat protein